MLHFNSQQVVKTLHLYKKYSHEKDILSHIFSQNACFQNFYSYSWFYNNPTTLSSLSGHRRPVFTTGAFNQRLFFSRWYSTRWAFEETFTSRLQLARSLLYLCKYLFELLTLYDTLSGHKINNNYDSIVHSLYIILY